jgi:intein/homing endonuclease
MKIGTLYEVLSFNIENKQFENNFAEVVNKTSKMVYEIELNCGRTVKCTDDHPLICEDPRGNIVTRTISEGLEGYKIIIHK